MKINAVIWDYDGTLADTRMKNINVTKAVVAEIMGDRYVKNSVLDSLENYEKANAKAANWRELYRNEFGMNDTQIDNAGKLWTKHQMFDKTEVQLFAGISFTITGLAKYSQGIVSQNSSKVIKNNLEKFNIEKYFNHIVGYEEVDYAKQKPNPTGLLTCISAITDLNVDNSVIYIGDHITDIECAHRCNDKLGNKTVISILLNNKRNNLSEGWAQSPDFIADHPENILEIIKHIHNSN